MMHFWEIWCLIGIGVILIIATAISVMLAWWRDRQRWKAVRPYYGKPYDASSKTYRPNVDLRRLR